MGALRMAAPQPFEEGTPAWRQLRWLGFISMATEKTVFYLDNLKLEQPAK